jgi:hypothetical protein
MNTFSGKFSMLLSGVIIFFASSCTTTVEQAVSTGNNSEILVYIDNKLWESPVGDSIRSIFMKVQDGLNQPEPMFTLLQLDKLDDLFKKHRNILRIIVNDTVKQPRLQYSDNVFAKPQSYVEAMAPDAHQLTELLKKGEKSLIDKFRQTDFLRIQRAYKMQENVPLQNQIRKDFGLSMVIPKSLYLAKSSPGFVWLRLETNRHSQGLMISRQDYLGENMLNPQFLLDWKNSITQLNIPGEVEGSYMITDTLTHPIVGTTTMNFGNATEIRGLWITMGDFMGGPYVSVFFTDPDKRYLYGLDGYVFYPSRDKRDLLLQLEAIIHSVEFSK